jgi:hypothetical protein
VSEQAETPATKVAALAKPSLPKGSLLSAALVIALVIASGVAVWLLQPRQMPEGRPVGQAGKVQVFAMPANGSSEIYTVWRNDRKTYEEDKNKSTIQRVEVSSNDIDVAGSPDPDLVLYTWTGGTHCCFSQILIDGSSGRRLGAFDIGNGDPTPFIPSQSKGLVRAVAINVDDVTAFKFGSYVDSPMARILIIWDEGRFTLDTKRMKAASPEGLPSFFLNEPELGEAASIGVQDFGVDEDNPAPASLTATVVRGDRAKTYVTWMRGEEARMRDTKLVNGDVSTYGPMAAFLNERIYKGQGEAGVASVLDAHKDAPDDANAALAYYFGVISKSRWLNDLDKLNDGQLKGLIGRYPEASGGRGSAQH